MKKYTVTIGVLSKVKKTIYANSPAEAEQKANNISIKELEVMAFEQGMTTTLSVESDAKSEDEKALSTLLDLISNDPSEVKEIYEYLLRWDVCEYGFAHLHKVKDNLWINMQKDHEHMTLRELKVLVIKD